MILPSVDGLHQHSDPYRCRGGLEANRTVYIAAVATADNARAASLAVAYQMLTTETDSANAIQPIS